jgi:hypothetical protein
MITAAQAREKTKERLTQVAKEFIVNTVEHKVDEAISFGQFSCTINHNHNVPFQEAIAELLEKEGFYVILGEGYYDIDWEKCR